MRGIIAAAVSTCLVAIPVGGQAQTAAFDVAGYQAAATALRDRLASGPTPQAQDPVVVAAVDRVAAATQAIDSPALPVDGMTTFQAICVPAVMMMGDYSDAAVNPAVAAAPTPAARARARAMGVDGIFLSRASTLFPMMALSLKCTLAHIGFFTSVLRDMPPEQLTDTKKKGAQSIRDGLFQQVDGAVKMTMQPAIGAARQLALLEMLARYAPEIADTLTASEKATVIASIRAVRAAWPAAGRESGATLLKALQNGGCSALCAA